MKQELEAKIASVKSALQGKDINAVRRAMQELSDAMQKVGASVYQRPGEPPGGEKSGKGEEGAVEGEFREV